MYNVNNQRANAKRLTVSLSYLELRWLQGRIQGYGDDGMVEEA
jgi:hypothetical protein